MICKISKHMTPGRCIKNQIEAEELFGARASECNSCPCDQGREIRNKSISVLSIRKPEEEVKKEKKGMPKIIGTCFNCKRPSMKVNNSNGTGICGSCQGHIIGTEPGSPEREAKLKEAAEKYAGKPKMTTGRRKKAGVEGIPETKPRRGADTTGYRALGTPKVEETLKTDIAETELKMKGTLTTADQNKLNNLCLEAERSEKVLTIKSVSYPNVSKNDVEMEIEIFNGIFLHFDTADDHKLREAIVAQARQFRRTPEQQILWLCQNEIKIHEELIKEAETQESING